MRIFPEGVNPFHRLAQDRCARSRVRKAKPSFITAITDHFFTGSQTKYETARVLLNQDSELHGEHTLEDGVRVWVKRTPCGSRYLGKSSLTKCQTVLIVKKEGCNLPELLLEPFSGLVQQDLKHNWARNSKVLVS